jgi:ABC-2 type transport system permease protein
MATLKKALAIIRKDILLRFSSKAELLYFLILPLFFTFLLAGGTPSGEDDNHIRVLVVDQSGSPLSGQLIVALEDSQTVRPELLPLEEAKAEFDERRASTLLVIPPGFDLEKAQTGGVELALYQQPNSINSLAAEQALRGAINQTAAALQTAQTATIEAERIRPFASQADRQAYFQESLALAQKMMEDAPQRLAVERASTADPVEYDPVASSSAGQMITWVFIPLAGISALFAYERRQGTLSRLLTTPTARGTYLFGTIIGQVLMALVQMALLLAFGILVMKLNWGREPLGLAVVLVPFALAAAALGTSLGTFIKSEGQANGLSIMTGMVFALLGGCWYPIELFPEFVRSAVKVLPTTWAMQGMLDLGLRGGGPADVMLEGAVLLGFALVFFSIGVWRFRYE